MSIIDMTVLSNGLQALVDSRLDTIDRMLMGRVSRRERLDIVRDVETQIYDLLAQHVPGDAEPTRDDLLSVLARLDPPEAYVPDHTDDTSYSTGSLGKLLPFRSRSATGAAGLSREQASAIQTLTEGRGLYSGVIAIAATTLSLLLFPLGYASVFILNSEICLLVLWFLALGLLFTGGIASVSLATLARLSNHWSVVGLVSGIFSILLSLVGTIEVFMIMN